MIRPRDTWIWWVASVGLILFGWLGCDAVPVDPNHDPAIVGCWANATDFATWTLDLGADGSCGYTVAKNFGSTGTTPCTWRTDGDQLSVTFIAPTSTTSVTSFVVNGGELDLTADSNVSIYHREVCK